MSAGSSHNEMVMCNLLKCNLGLKCILNDLPRRRFIVIRYKIRTCNSLLFPDDEGIMRCYAIRYVIAVKGKLRMG